MLNLQLGAGAVSSGICCISIGDGAVARGAFQVNIATSLSFPSDVTPLLLDNLVEAMRDLSLTHQAMVTQKFAPEEFGVRSESAIKIAIDACIRHRQTLVDRETATTTEEDHTTTSKGKEEADGSTSTSTTTQTESQTSAEQVD